MVPRTDFLLCSHLHGLFQKQQWHDDPAAILEPTFAEPLDDRGPIELHVARNCKHHYYALLLMQCMPLPAVSVRFLAKDVSTCETNWEHLREIETFETYMALCPLIIQSNALKDKGWFEMTLKKGK